MKATNLLNEKIVLNDNTFVQMVVWDVPTPVAGSDHAYKYSLALIIDQECVMRYDNEAGKGNHKHIIDREVPFQFTTIEAMLESFWKDVEAFL